MEEGAASLVRDLREEKNAKKLYIFKNFAISKKLFFANIYHSIFNN
jgi:hypothetical protein